MTTDNATDSLRSRFEQIFQCIGDGDLRELAELVSHDVLDHRRIPGQGDGLPGTRYWAERLRSRFPDLTARVDDTVVEGSKVAGRVTFSGTAIDHGLATAPTDPWVEFEFFVFMRFEHGRVVEWWDATNTLDVLKGLGVRFEAPPGSDWESR